MQVSLSAGLSAEIQALSVVRSRVAVAIDGADAAGKTTFADQVAHSVPGVVIRASIDAFHRPKAAG